MPLFLKSILHVLIETCKTHQILHDDEKKKKLENLSTKLHLVSASMGT